MWWCFAFKKKWNESGFRPHLCTYMLNWARRTSWGWWDDWDDTVLQTQDSKFEPWRSEAENATSRSQRLPTILTFTRGWGRNIFVSFKPPRPGTEPQTLAWKAAVLTTTLGPPPFAFKAFMFKWLQFHHHIYFFSDTVILVQNDVKTLLYTYRFIVIHSQYMSSAQNVLAVFDKFRTPLKIYYSRWQPRMIDWNSILLQRVSVIFSFC